MMDMFFVIMRRKEGIFVLEYIFDGFLENKKIELQCLLNKIYRNFEVGIDLMY